MAGELDNCTNILVGVLNQLQPEDVKDREVDCWYWIDENWPVIHVPLYANVFALAFCYYRAIQQVLSDPNSKLKGLCNKEKKVAQKFLIPHEKWGEFPEFDEKRKHHLFVADRHQVDRWRKYRSFWAGSVFTYKHEFILYKTPTTAGNNFTWDEFLLEIRNEKQILIVSDLSIEADKLKSNIISQICSTCKADENKIRNIDITSPGNRSMQEVLSAYALNEEPSCRLLLFGTPYGDLLKSSNNGYSTVEYNIEEAIETYVCWVSNLTSEPVTQLRAFYEFFEELFKSDGPFKLTIVRDSDMHKLAKAFHRLAEVNARILRVGLDDKEFTKHFCSCADHCKATDPFKIEQKGGLECLMA